MRCMLPKYLVLAAIAFAVALANSAPAQAQGAKYQLGRTPTAEEVQSWDISVGPAGKELPPGSGTAKIGADIFAEKCVVCHGENGEGSKMAPRLVSAKVDPKSPWKRAIGDYWPFATTVWDYINRAMPRFQGGSLKPDEVYALTAFLLYKNTIIQEETIIDAKSLPKIEMPNRNGFIPSPWPLYPRPGERPFGLYP
jgi:S-disulfanyl-L-cysteine oxidoreductase SoxD